MMKELTNKDLNNVTGGVYDPLKARSEFSGTASKVTIEINAYAGGRIRSGNIFEFDFNSKSKDSDALL